MRKEIVISDDNNINYIKFKFMKSVSKTGNDTRKSIKIGFSVKIIILFRVCRYFHTDGKI